MGWSGVSKDCQCPIAAWLIFAVRRTSWDALVVMVSQGHCQRVTGVLVPPEDAEGLDQAILHLLRNKDLACQMGVAGRETILTHFSMKRLHMFVVGRP